MTIEHCEECIFTLTKIIFTFIFLVLFLLFRCDEAATASVGNLLTEAGTNANRP